MQMNVPFFCKFYMAGPKAGPSQWQGLGPALSMSGAATACCPAALFWSYYFVTYSQIKWYDNYDACLFSQIHCVYTVQTPSTTQTSARER